ncbi:MAG TPA: hypothetical protein VM537_03660 [Anaerolineae bacterium]|nr:hypothetical protein [Anaerolineae bacterium]
MKKILSLLAALVIVGVLVVGFRGSCDSTDTHNPESVARAAIMALESYDIDEVCSYFTGSAYGQMAEGLDEFYSLNSNIKITNATAAAIDRTVHMATLYISYDLSREIYGHADTIHVSKNIQAISQNGVWYLNSSI